MKDSPTLITATEVPFIPVLKTTVDEPYEALMLPATVPSKRKRRSVANYDMWGCNYQLI